jgi:anti-sigma factor RsiW
MAVSPDDLTCRELVELVTDFLEGALAPAEAARFETHLAHCPECRDHVDDLRATIALAGRVGAVSLSADAQARLLAAFRGWRGEESTPNSPAAFRSL